MSTEFRDRVIRTTSVILTGAGSLLVPNIAHAEHPAKLLAANDPVFLQGDGSNNNHLRVLLIGQNGTTLPMLNEVKDDLSSISPMDEFRPIMDVAGILGGNELGCDQNAQCSWTKVNDVINGYLARGLVFHETMVVIKSNDGGGAGYTPIFPSHLSKPDIYSPSAIVRSADTRGFRELFSRTAVHEFLHQLAGFDHEGGDIMQSICNCINAQHTQFLRSLKPLVPFNYDVKKLELRPTNLNRVATLSAAGVYQLNDMGFILGLQTPTGTYQHYSEVVPFGNDGAGVFDYASGFLAEQAWADAGRIVPSPPQWYGILPDMTYTWRVRVSGLTTPITDAQGNVIRDDPRWDKTEIWPGVFVPNPWEEVKIHTPATTLDTIALKNVPVTNDLTPTLTWENTNTKIFYYEVQVSKDPNFNTDPVTANSMVYWELRHGGVTKPKNSYTIPDNFPLEKGTEYFWRVRPRIQGDGKPMEWTPAAKFTTTADAKVMAYSKELVDKDYGQGVIGPSKEDYDRFASKEPEPVTPSPLARVFYTQKGPVFIPEEGARDYSNSSVKPVSMAEYRAYLKASQRRLQRGRKLTPAA